MGGYRVTMTIEPGSDSVFDGVFGLPPDGTVDDADGLATPMTASFTGPVLEPTKTRHSARYPTKTRHSASLPGTDDLV